MARLSFGDFLNQAGPSEGRGRGRGRGRGGGRGGGGRGGGGRGGGRGGRGGGGGDSSRGRGGGRSLRGGHFGADYSSVPLDYSQYTKSTYHRFELQPFAPDPAREPSERGRGRGGARGRGSGRGRGGPRGGVGFTPGGATPGPSSAPTSVPTSVPGSGTATPITGGLGYHRRAAPRTAARTVDGVVTWGGGRAPLFIKAGELFRDGEVDVVKRDGDTLVLETYPLSDPSAPQMCDLHDDAEVELAPTMGEDELESVLGVVADAGPVQASEVAAAEASLAQRQAAADLAIDIDAESPADREDVEAVLSEHMETALVVDDHTVVLEHEHRVVYSPSAPVGALPETQALPLPAHVEEVHETTAIVEDDTPASPRDVPAADTDMSGDGAESGIDSAEPADDSALFFVDTGGDTTADFTAPSELVYDAPTFERAPTPPAPAEEDESIVYRPRLMDDPWTASGSSSQLPRPAGWEFGTQGVYIDPRVMMGRKARKAAKKEAKKDKRGRSKRARRKDGRAGLGGGVQPQDLEGADDSDLDWGSDAPAVLGVVGADHDVGDEEIDPDLDDAALERFGAGMARIRHDNDAMAYMPSDSDEYDDDDVAATREQIAEGPSESASSASDDDDDDDDESSTDNDFSRLADAYGDSDDEEHAEEGEARMFTGTNQWKDDADDDGDAEEQDDAAANEEWFLESMESALDGGAMSAPRRERNRVFRAVANGSFDEALPIAPAKKADKKGSDLPLELQEQWQRDRAKKAEKKRERELQRALAMLDPTAKFGRKGKKGKGAAASIAHLIPGSAEEVAQLFDVDDDDGGWGVEAPRRSNPLLPPTLADIDHMVQQFMLDPGRTTLPLMPMDKEGRRKIHMLAECYDLKSKSKGSGAARFPILIKLARSGLRNADMRDRIVSAGGVGGKAFYKALYARQRDTPTRAARGTGASARAREGETVGEGAEKIGEDNVGHRLLSKMGWSEGVSIGRAGGLDAPIVAVVKNTKRGLGS